MRAKLINGFSEDYAKLFKACAAYFDENSSKFILDITKEYFDDEKITILDVCCGAGLNTRDVVEAGHTVVGVDASMHMLSTARELSKDYQRGAIPYFIMDNAEFFSENFLHSFTDNFKLAYCMTSFGLLGSVSNFLSNVKQAIQKDGILIFDFWNEKGFENWFKNGDYSPQFSQGEISDGIFRLQVRFLMGGYCHTTYKYAMSKTDYQFVTSHSVALFSIDEVKKLLEEAGYMSIEFYNGKGYTKELASDENMYITVVAQKS